MEKIMYEKIVWPDVRKYMEDDDYVNRVYFDPENNVWFVPEDMIKRHEVKEKEKEQ